MNKVYAVYFSATGTTKTSVTSIAKAINSEITELDFTVKGTEKAVNFDKNDVLVIGGPVYGGRIYKGAMERFSALKGDSTPCVIAAVYGNRDYDDALVELEDFLTERGFIVTGAAALVAEHTYGKIQLGRPNASDIEENTIFGRKIAEKINNTDYSKPSYKGNRPYKDGGKGGAFRPLTSDKCTNCMLCVKNCPENAIAEDCRTIDNDKCIACFRCIKSCPTGAKNMDTPAYNEFSAMFTERLKERRENEYYL